jgi:molecular chaperone GrpE
MRPDNQDAETNALDAEERRSAEITEDQPDGAEGTIETEVEGGVEGDVSVSPIAEELEAMRDRYLRLAAEFDNYRKRTEREKAEERDRSQGQLLEKLLEPLDDLRRVTEHNLETGTEEALLEGVRLVERKLMKTLESLGLEMIAARGEPFDPMEHEAVMVAATSEEAEDDTIGEVFQHGYRFRGILLRPARVQVRKHQG